MGALPSQIRLDGERISYSIAASGTLGQTPPPWHLAKRSKRDRTRRVGFLDGLSARVTARSGYFGLMVLPKWEILNSPERVFAHPDQNFIDIEVARKTRFFEKTWFVHAYHKNLSFIEEVKTR